MLMDLMLLFGVACFCGWVSVCGSWAGFTLGSGVAKSWCFGCGLLVALYELCLVVLFGCC